MTNLFETYTEAGAGRWARLARWKKVLIVFFGILLTLVLILGGWGLANAQSVEMIKSEALAGKDSFEFAQVALGSQNFELAAKDLGEAQEHFKTAQDHLGKFKAYTIIPGVAKQIRAVDDILTAGVNLASGLKTLAIVGDKVNAVIASEGDDVSIGDISPEDKRDVLKALSESTVELAGVRSDIELAVLSIEQIPDEGLMTEVKEAIDPIKSQLPLLDAIIHQAIPAAESLPTILGYPTEQTYLFLLQNNRELRPTGGFIGTIGIINMDGGEIETFETENVYNLDSPASEYVTEPSPGPIAQHTSTQQWFLRDINWSPDFPTTALKARDKYYEEGGAAEGIDGVIAVTPTFIESLLRVTGPITIDGIEFTADNLFETLEYQVEYAFAEKGIDDSERKEVIGDLSAAIMDEIFALPKSEFGTLWEVFVEDIDTKQILVYVDDPITQDLVMEQNWGGEMKDPKGGDFLMFVDANLAALKTDNVMEREVSYSVSRDGDDYVGEAEMLYTNTGWFDGFHTRYRTYTRVYLPEGAELIESSGFKTGDKTQNGQATDPDVSTETFTRLSGEQLTYTVVGGFTSIEPHESGTLRLKYRLPEQVVAQIKSGTYNAYIQKQAGTAEPHGLRFNFDVGRNIESVTPLDLFSDLGDNAVSLESDLSVDREISVRLK